MRFFCDEDIDQIFDNPSHFPVARCQGALGFRWVASLQIAAQFRIVEIELFLRDPRRLVEDACDGALCVA